MKDPRSSTLPGAASNVAGTRREGTHRKAPVAHAKTKSLRELAKKDRFTGRGAPPELKAPRAGGVPAIGGSVPQPLMRAPSQTAPMPATNVNGQGISSAGYLPPDSSGDVGLTQYVIMTNIKMAVFDKETAAKIQGSEVFLATMWSALAGDPDAICDNESSGDPIVLYDQMADRWFISQFALIDFAGPYDYHQCIAVSTTGDATGSYHVYDYLWDDRYFNDYPHFGVWPDGYYMAVNEFDDVTGSFAGAAVAAFDRDAMLAGTPNAAVQVRRLGTGYASLLPSDMDGKTLPPAGSPNHFAMIDDQNDALHLFDYSVNWDNPAGSTWTSAGTLGVSAFSTRFCGSYYANCVPQPGTTAVLDPLADRLMFRLAYRNFGTHQSLVVNHTIQMLGGSSAASDNRAGIRWYEVRDPNGTPSLYQWGNHAPNATNRWMGSAAQDASGNMALGYSFSSSTVSPGIAYAGRLAADPLNTLPRTETVLQAGGGSQTHSSGRWGDYTHMSVDPVDDCTFWYVNQYYTATASAAWTTRFASFKFPDCGPASLGGTVTDAITGAPIEGATVSVGSYKATTAADGSYLLQGLQAGTHDVTAKAAGHRRAPAVTAEVSLEPTDVDLELFPLGASDLNGDGFEDVVIGVPGENLGSKTDGGAIQILYGTAAGPTAVGDEIVHQDTADANGVAKKGDRFGSAVATGDFNADGFSDLAVGIPNKDVGTKADAGAVHVFMGHANGILDPGTKVSATDIVFTQDSGGIYETAEAGDRFGSSLATGDFDGDGFQDLAVGAPYEDFSISGKTRSDAGAVHVIYGSASGLRSTYNQVWHQNSTSVADWIEAGDRFGSSLAAGDMNGDGRDDLAIGAPMEDGSSRLADSGAVHVLYGSASRLTGSGSQQWHQDAGSSSAPINGGRAAGDRFGAAVAVGDLNGDGFGDLISGIPGENSGGDNDSGGVSIIYGSASRLTSSGDQLWNQDSSWIRDTTEAYDRFGMTVAAGDLTGDGIDDLAIGVPGEDLSGKRDVGAVALLKGTRSKVTGSGSLLVAQKGVSGATLLSSDSAEPGDAFGTAIALGHTKGGLRATLLVGAPSEDIAGDANGGVLNVVFGAAGLITTSGNRAWAQDSSSGGYAIDDSTEPGDWFGAALA